MTDVHERLNIVEAREAIRELRARYCWFVARGDYRSLASLYTEECLFEFTKGGRRVALRSRADILETLSKSMKPGLIFPFVQSDVLTVEGDTAYGTCTMHTPTAPGFEQTGFRGYYHDRLRRCDGQWLFTQRRWFLYWPSYEDSGIAIDAS